MFDEPLRLALWLGLAGIVLELVALPFRTLLMRRVLYGSMIFLTSFAASVLLIVDLRLGTVCVAFVALYRIFNGLRVASARIKPNRLLHASRRSSIILLFMQVTGLLFWQAQVIFGWESWTLLYGMVAVSLLTSLGLLQFTRRNLRRTALRPSDKYMSDDELPTVSVCIPARNETDYLPACLESVLASDYPKLEVLVLDDCSQDRTSEIIKSFAQAGIRFIRGETPQRDWLAKNQAYQALADAASGELLLFMGVDVRLDTSAIRSLVGTLQQRKKSMISVLPQGLQKYEHAGLVQPMRYWWELVLPRRIFNRPPVLSTLWIIERQTLFGLGGFGSVRGSMLPEGFFARELVKRDTYSFMRASGALGVTTVKRLPEQWQTFIRTSYPKLRKRPENVLLLGVAQLWLLALPLGIFMTGFFGILPPLLWLLGGLNAVVLFAIHWCIVQAWGIRDALPLMIFPAAVLTELLGMHISMWRYEFGTVLWKERNVCIPVMKHTRALPPL